MTARTIAHLGGEATLTGGHASYFDYQRRVAREVMIPWLEREQVPLEGAAVADFGSHAGGFLEALREDGRVSSAVGYELNAAVVEESPFAADERFRLQVASVLDIDVDGQFDLVLMCELMEHVPETDRLLAAASRSLRRGGVLAVTFPPYWSPFGGHQHLASTWLRTVPYVHYLPERTFFRMARIGDNPYMTRDAAIEDVVSVRRTRLTIERAERAFRRAGFLIRQRRTWLLRPEHQVRYGVRPRRAGVLGAIPLVRDISVVGADYLLVRQ